MNIDVMRFVDRFVGIPLCWIMGLYSRIAVSSRSGNSTHEVRNILVIKFFGLGSIVMTTPALGIMKSVFPEAHITFLSFERNRGLLERYATIEVVLTIDTSSGFAFLRDVLRTTRAIVRLRPEITFDLEFFSKFSTLLSAVSRAPVRVAFALPTYWRSSIVTHQVPLNKNIHVLHSFCEQVFSVTHSRVEIPPVEPPRVLEEDHASLLSKFPIGGARLILINVNAGETFLERRWPQDRFAKLVSMLAHEDDGVFCFIGGPRETAYVRGTIGNTECPGRCIDTSGQLTIPELAALMKRSELLISNDSGPLHLAASLGTPTIGLYGPESPHFYGLTQDKSDVVYAGISCSPCMNVYSAKQFRCPYRAQCMRDISVDDVLQSIRSFVVVK